jgi:hypothetical protein
MAFSQMANPENGAWSKRKAGSFDVLIPTAADDGRSKWNWSIFPSTGKMVSNPYSLPAERDIFEPQMIAASTRMRAHFRNAAQYCTP